MVAGRCVEEEDLRSILVKNKNLIAPKHVNKSLSQFRKICDHEAILERFYRLLKTP
jgi:hypothetical protein